MKIHELKCWPEPFAATVHDLKRFEFRVDDRGFEVGDVLILREWDPHNHNPDRQAAYSGRSFTTTVLYLQRGPAFGIPEGFVVMSITQSGRL